MYILLILFIQLPNLGFNVNKIVKPFSFCTVILLMRELTLFHYVLHVNEDKLFT